MYTPAALCQTRSVNAVTYSSISFSLVGYIYNNIIVIVKLLKRYLKTKSTMAPAYYERCDDSKGKFSKGWSRELSSSPIMPVQAL